MLRFFYAQFSFQILSMRRLMCYNLNMSDKKKLKIKIHFGKLSAILIAVFAALIAVDLILKYCEVKYDWNFTVIPKLIWVESGVKNFGAAFSFLSDTEWGRVFFIVLTFIMLAVMVCAFLLLPERFTFLKTALSMVAAGALCNLIDRLALGYVRDFVWVNIFGTPACCNFADFWIVFGVILAVIDVLFLNEWAVLPLTKRAKQAAKNRELAENAGADKAVAEEKEPVAAEEKTEEVEIKRDGGEDDAD